MTVLPIGKKIRKARLQKDITQEQLAEEVGVSNAHISHSFQDRMQFSK